MAQRNYNGVLPKPVNPGFGAIESTANTVMHGMELQGKVAIVTGGYAGIGLENTRALSSAGATVIVPAQDIEKAGKNLEDVANVEIEMMDLMNPASIDAFAEKFLASNRLLNILINNAGVMPVPLRRNHREFELQLATSHLGYFQLTARLWPALKKAEGSRVVNLSSFEHKMTPLENANLNNPKYQAVHACGQSKAIGNLFAVELGVCGPELDVRAYSLQPGESFFEPAHA